MLLRLTSLDENRIPQNFKIHHHLRHWNDALKLAPRQSIPEIHQWAASSLTLVTLGVEEDLQQEEGQVSEAHGILALRCPNNSTRSARFFVISWGRYWVYTGIYGYTEFWPDSTRVKHNMSWSQMSWSKLSASFMIFTAMQSRGQAWVLLHETYCVWHKFKKNWWERNILLPHGNVRPY